VEFDESGWDYRDLNSQMNMKYACINIKELNLDILVNLMDDERGSQNCSKDNRYVTDMILVNILMICFFHYSSFRIISSSSAFSSSAASSLSSNPPTFRLIQWIVPSISSGNLFFIL
jgi:hypothetical protein